ncbi:UDP-glucose 4-epimerase GalE [Actinomadura rayongensis]|uniref:UDP-glucose 4-epimerase n=1 Tax=Actinomadura rayongensis TaxID=1429076 RepID=A0A6I4W8E5_9ACTN|nr:UDP-glucose 4-epimerase GalE [Actinomadura rayongensis]MXQ65761.1 UDP-glucose 4-epimerase GalE [Actinomadura rayongensis]
MKLLVTGGAGYVGSVVAARLLEFGHRVVVLDDLSTGHADACPAGARLVRGTLRGAAFRVLAEGGFDAVLHLAARSVADGSASWPEDCWDVNLGETLVLLDAMRRTGVDRIVASSTAAVYGKPTSVPVRETDPTAPTGPFGAARLAVDQTLEEFARRYGLGGVSLRHANVAGAYGRHGERHAVETHLVPNLLAVALGRRDRADLFGTDHPTPDGTCVRDYVHVADLGAAYALALQACEPGRHVVYNVGGETGYSVKDVLDVCREVTGRPIPVRVAPRRPGDAPVLVASAARIGADLGWTARRGLPAMVEDAWRFHRDGR